MELIMIFLIILKRALKNFKMNSGFLKKIERLTLQRCFIHDNF